MKLENVTAEIRPRGKWESVDLGVALVQRNYLSILLGWSLTVVPMMLVLLGFAYTWYSLDFFRYDEDSLWLYKAFYVPFPFILTWWLKPIYERVPLYIISRSLFGEKVNLVELIQQWPKMIIKNAFTLLVLRRVAMNRSFVMPIHELEGLKGSQYKQRVRLLSRNGGDGASSLCMSCSLLSFISMLSVFTLYIMLSANGFSNDTLGEGISLIWDALFLEAMDRHAVMPLVSFLAFYMCVISLLAPFYSGAGFAIYINSRTVSEGWDIELAFKRMSERLKNLRKGKSVSILGLVLGFSLSVLFTQPLEAAVRNEDNRAVESIMESEDFDLQIDKQKVYQYDEIETSERDTSSGLDLSSLGTVLMYLFAIVAIVLIVYLIIANAHIFRAGRKGKIAEIEASQPKARSVLGMDVTPESLPKDIVAAARQAWLAGDKQLALSLFYRGSLEWMVNAAHLPILESDTESDCVRHVETLRHEAVRQYFSRLTDTWMSLAYGKISPEENAIDWLSADWPFNQRTIVVEQEEQA